MSVKTLRQLEQRSLSDSCIEVVDANLLIDSTKDGGAVPAAKTLIETFSCETPPTSSEVLLGVLGPDTASIDDDMVFLSEGHQRGQSNVPAYTRSYDSMLEGPLAREYAGVARAYSSDQWKRVFTSPGLEAAAAFGAAW